MWPFKKEKPEPILIRKPEPKSEPEDRTITFRSSDTLMERAENIWTALGFVNDRHGAIPSIAGYLSIYYDWDQKAAKEEKEEE